MTSNRWCRVLTPLFVLSLLPALAATAAEDEISRTASGHPDLSGTYDAATLTPLVRPREFGDNLYLTREEAEKIAQEEAFVIAARNASSDPEREAPPEGGDGSEGAAGNVGGYNAFWIDRGTGAFDVDGKFRTSIIVEPKNGQMPEMTPEARAERGSRFRGGGRRSNDGTAYWLKEEGPGPYDDIETRSTAERCILGFTGATPTFPSLYNNFKRIVQTDDHVMILIEMVHDARIVRLNSEHLPERMDEWLGDSIGWWEGDTLVVETKNFRPGQGRGGSPEMTVTERFTKQAGGDVLYRFTVDDPSTWVEPWTGEYVWRSTDSKVYEYACHEGNYAMGNILRGARMLEQDAMAGKAEAGQ